MLEVTPSMVYQVIAGKKQLSDKALYRLGTIESKAGIVVPVAPVAHAPEPGPGRSGVDGHIQMRLSCLVDIIETLSADEMHEALDRLNVMADSEPKFGKILGETANIVAAVYLKRQSKTGANKGGK